MRGWDGGAGAAGRWARVRGVRGVELFGVGRLGLVFILGLRLRLRLVLGRRYV